MKTIYTHEDAIKLKAQFRILRPELIDSLCEWLKENNQVVEATNCHDAQSGWSGTDFFIGKANLSLNGYCLKNDEIELFLNGGQNRMWYCFYDPEYKEALKWEEDN